MPVGAPALFSLSTSELLSEAMELDGQESSPVREAPPPTLIQNHQERQPSREKQKARFDAVVAAYEEGVTLRAISRKFVLSRTTIRRFVRAKEFLERAPRRRRSELDSFRGYLQKRWAEGRHNASQLCRELHQQGYGGGRSRVKEYVQPWRANSVPACSKPRRRTLPNLRLIALWLSKAPTKRSPHEQRWAEAVIASHPQVATVEQLAQQFRQVFQDRDSDALKSWMKRSVASDIPELKRFVAGIERDYEAVSAAVEQHWSNGQVEGPPQAPKTPNVRPQWLSTVAPESITLYNRRIPALSVTPPPKVRKTLSVSSNGRFSDAIEASRP
jgi:Transposase